MAYGGNEADVAAATIDTYLQDNALDLFSTHNPLMAILRNKSQDPGMDFHFRQSDIAEGNKIKVPVFGKRLNTAVAGVTRANQINAISVALPAGLTNAYYEWTHYQGIIFDSAADRMKNRGKAQMVDWGEVAMASLRADFIDKPGTDLWDGVVGTEDKIQSVNQCLLNTGTVGGIDQSDGANNGWWQAQVDSVAGAFNTYDLDKSRLACNFDTGLPTGISQADPDLVFLYGDLYASLLQQLKPSQRQEVQDTVKGGGKYLLYSGMQCRRNNRQTANTVVGMNSSTWFFRYATDAPDPVTPGFVPVSATPSMWQKGYNWFLGFGCMSPKHNFIQQNKTAA